MTKRRKCQRREDSSSSDSRSCDDDEMSPAATTPIRSSKSFAATENRRNTRRREDKGIKQMLKELKEDRCLMLKELEEDRSERRKQLKILCEIDDVTREIRKQVKKLTESHNELRKNLVDHINGSSGDDSAAPRSESNEGQPPRYHLEFTCKVNAEIEKGKIIKTDHGETISVALRDDKQIVESGPLASATVMLVVVNGEFNQHGTQYNWLRKDFEQSIKRPPQKNSAMGDVNNKPESIVSNCIFKLKGGVKSHTGATILYNSSNKKVRLGVMLLSPTERVLEGLSNPFFVRGHDRPARQSNPHYNGSKRRKDQVPLQREYTNDMPLELVEDGRDLANTRMLSLTEGQTLVGNGRRERNDQMFHMENASRQIPTQPGEIKDQVPLQREYTNDMPLELVEDGRDLANTRMLSLTEVQTLVGNDRRERNDQMFHMENASRQIPTQPGEIRSDDPVAVSNTNALSTESSISLSASRQIPTQPGEISLHPGFRFHATDKELILHYLLNRVATVPYPVKVFPEVDINKFNPWDLPGGLYGEHEHYFFSPWDPKGIYCAAGSGYWKAMGTNDPISRVSNPELGFKRVFVFYKGRVPSGTETNWTMNVYSLDCDLYNSIKKNSRPTSSMQVDKWVLCKIYEKHQLMFSQSAISDQNIYQQKQQLSTSTDEEDLSQPVQYDSWTDLPLGICFEPTDEELILHYLRNRTASLPCPVPIIADVDIYKFEPWDLPGKALFGDKEWYFFSQRECKYGRVNRATVSGYWKDIGEDKPIHVTASTPWSGLLGSRKTLVFFRGHAPRATKTEWIMHEYLDVSTKLEDWVLCRIFKKETDKDDQTFLTEGLDRSCSSPKDLITSLIPNTTTTRKPFVSQTSPIFSSINMSTVEAPDLLEHQHVPFGETPSEDDLATAELHYFF